MMVLTEWLDDSLQLINQAEYYQLLILAVMLNMECVNAVLLYSHSIASG